MADIRREIEHRLIDAHVAMARLDAAERRRVGGMLADIEREITSLIREYDPLAVSFRYQRERIERLIAEVTLLLDDRYSSIARTMDADLREAAQLSGDLAMSAINDAFRVDIVTNALTPAQAGAITREMLIEGAPSAEWWSHQSESLAARFAREMRIGLARGETIQQLTQRVTGRKATPDRPAIRGILQTARYQAEALVRTSVMSAANVGRLALYNENSALIDGIQWLATLDNRTCVVCGELDGKAWTLDYQPVNHSYPYPGATEHISCRCTTIPVMKDWSALISNKRIAAALNQMDADAGTRASVGGPVPATTTYEDWLRAQSADTRAEILGPTRADLFDRGKIGFTALVDTTLRPLTVEQIRQRLP